MNQGSFFIEGKVLFIIEHEYICPNEVFFDKAMTQTVNKEMLAKYLEKKIADTWQPVQKG